MSEIGAYEAKTHLPELLKRVERGERFVITRHGRAVAELRPVGGAPRGHVAAIVRRMKRFQAGHSLGGASSRELIDEGRRY
jgi:prevent-host-death family protein